jgi:hypothetical protein
MSPAIIGAATMNSHKSARSISMAILFTLEVAPRGRILTLQCLLDIGLAIPRWFVCSVQDLYVMRLVFKVFGDGPARRLMLGYGTTDVTDVDHPSG